MSKNKLTEKEKMLAEQVYDPLDPELVQDRYIANKKTRQYNALSEVDFSLEELVQKRTELLQGWFGKVGKDVWIEPPFTCDYGYNIFLGDRVFFNANCIILDVTEVHIGDRTQIGPHVQIYAANHPTDPERRRRWEEFANRITIGEGVWIGGGAIINPGITIGDNTTIGSGSVVTKDIPANVIAAGNPCRVIKYLK